MQSASTTAGGGYVTENLRSWCTLRPHLYSFFFFCFNKDVVDVLLAVRSRVFQEPLHDQREAQTQTDQGRTLAELGMDDRLTAVGLVRVVLRVRVQTVPSEPNRGGMHIVGAPFSCP